MPARKGVPKGYNHRNPNNWIRYDKDEAKEQAGLRAIAEERIKGLIDYAEWHPIPHLLASAYMQGINDALYSLKQSGIALVPQELAQPND